MELKERFLNPGLHPSQILQALHAWASALKVRMGLPVQTISLGALGGIWENARWDSATMSKGFGIVAGACIPCRISVVSQTPTDAYVQVDSQPFDAYYGVGACYRCLLSYQQRKLGFTSPEKPEDRDESCIPEAEQQIPALRLPPPPGRLRSGAKAARKAADDAGAGKEAMNAVNRLAELIGFSEQGPVLAAPALMTYPARELGESHEVWLARVRVTHPDALRPAADTAEWAAGRKASGRAVTPADLLDRPKAADELPDGEIVVTESSMADLLISLGL